MQLECEACHSPLRAEDVRFDLALAKCHACDAVHDLTGRKARELAPTSRERRPIRPRAALPERIQVEEDGQSTVLTWRWFKKHHLLMACFCVFWDGMLFNMYRAMLEKGNVSLVELLFPMMHVGAGVFLTYSTLAGFLNRTRIEASRDELHIQHGPLPWPGNRTLSARQLTQLYATEVRGNKGSVSYTLLALDRRGHKVELLSGLDDKDQVLYLEQTLERRLGIEDDPVDGELGTRDHAG
ncbi:hypothetical protein JRI60_44830 [Archangium violaceum]|uniref:hypothetical protein n=1 Tax=Archangium violaceum TaxID=83451 RepID=UPI00194E1C2E|nr:hypothetical protein [Archangium violaceum]QRN96083.1 hypothetical protein JRI60_44830 [Archangium violaceum]